MMHTGRARQVQQQRQRVLDAAYAAHPERFVNKRPQPPVVPTAAWINPPENKQGDVPLTVETEQRLVFIYAAILLRSSVELIRASCCWSAATSFGIAR